VRRSQQERRKTIIDDYITYMGEDVNDIGKVENLGIFFHPILI